MNEKKERRKRYNEKLQYIAEMEKWFREEPKMINIIKWHKWKIRRPKSIKYVEGNDEKSDI